MSLVFPNNPENYKLLFEELATKHVNIRHAETPDRENFCLINFNSGLKGFSDTDIRNFLNKKKKTNSKNTENSIECQMIVIRMETSSNGALLKSNQKVASGSFAILSNPVDQKASSIDDAYNNCYNVANDCYSAIKKLFAENPILGTLEELETEAIRVDANVGYRFDFSWKIYSAMCYNESRFNNLTIEEI